jgi:hypothetical protein
MSSWSDLKTVSTFREIKKETTTTEKTMLLARSDTKLETKPKEMHEIREDSHQISGTRRRS